MITETTKVSDGQPARGWVFYDGTCPLCLRLLRWFGRAVERRGFALAPLQTPWVRERLALPEAELLREMRVLMPDNRVLGGADSVVHLAARIWWAWPVVLLARLPGGLRLLHSIYRWVASNRGCTDGTCQIEPAASREAGFLGWLPLLLLPPLAFVGYGPLPPWGFMWLLAFALYFGCKFLTCADAPDRGAGTSTARRAAYLFLWVGMDAKAFLDESAKVERPGPGEWLFAFGKALLGAALLWVVTPAMFAAHPLIAGWTGMFGIVFSLHFGLFHLASLAWRAAGVNARPIMQAPILSRSLAELWGRRWNLAFHDIVHRWTFRPLRARVGVRVAMIGVFLLSGLVHDLVISVPARGGYGLPTVYFVLQGVGVLAEHSAAGRWLGLGRGVRGWVFTVACAAAPAPLLFHAPFIERVILPFLRVLLPT